MKAVSAERRTVHFIKSKQMSMKMRKDDDHPTLESGANTPAVDLNELDNPEYTRFEEAAARRKAVGLYNQVLVDLH